MDSDIQLVIFDLDGTLVDAYKAVSMSLNHALNTCGFDSLDDYTIQRSVGWGEKEQDKKGRGKNEKRQLE